jgi:hypothetical protein
MHLGRAYDRMKYEGVEQNMLDHAPVIQDESLRGTSLGERTALPRSHGSLPAERNQHDGGRYDVHPQSNRPVGAYARSRRTHARSNLIGELINARSARAARAEERT